MTPTLLPAYGRDYKSKQAVLDSFYGGLDFVYCTPIMRTYCSKRDFKPGDMVAFRYGMQRKVFYHTVQVKNK